VNPAQKSFLDHAIGKVSLLSDAGRDELLQNCRFALLESTRRVCIRQVRRMMIAANTNRRAPVPGA
jgi:hypothetical protein